MASPARSYVTVTVRRRGAVWSYILSEPQARLCVRQWRKRGASATRSDATETKRKPPRGPIRRGYGDSISGGASGKNLTSPRADANPARRTRGDAACS